MSDNTTLPGTGEVYASDDIAGVKFPRVKLIHGADGSNDGDVALTNPLPVRVPSGLTLNAPSGIAVLTPSYLNVGLATALVQLLAPSGLTVANTTSNPLPIVAPSMLNVGLATGLLQMFAPSGIRTIAPSLTTVGFQTGIMQIVAPSGLAVTGNLSASIGTGTFVGITASGLPVASGNPLPVTVVSGGDGSVQGVDAHDAAVTADPLTIGGYASAAAPTDVSGDGDATRAWFLRNGAQVIGIQAAGALIGAGLGTAATALRVTVARDSEPLAITQASGTTHRVVQPSGTSYTVGPASGALFSVAQPTGSIFQTRPNPIDVHGSAPTGNPYLLGLEARGDDRVGVASGSVVRAVADLNGKQIVQPFAPLGMRLNGLAGVQGTGSRTVIPAQGSGFRIAVTAITAVNGSPTYPSELVLHDGTTSLYGGYCGERGGGFAPNGGGFPLFITAANAALQAVNLASGASTNVNVSAFRVPVT